MELQHIYLTEHFKVQAENSLPGYNYWFISP